MAHWAEIDENNIVIRVVVGNNDASDEGYQWLIDNLGGTWLKTSYNTHEGKHILGGVPYRKNYAQVGFNYNAIKDAFIPPKPTYIEENDPLLSLVLNEETCNWDIVSTEPELPVFEE
jgi:hypothetical protein